MLNLAVWLISDVLFSLIIMKPFFLFLGKMLHCSRKDLANRLESWAPDEPFERLKSGESPESDDNWEK